MTKGPEKSPETLLQEAAARLVTSANTHGYAGVNKFRAAVNAELKVLGLEATPENVASLTTLVKGSNELTGNGTGAVSVLENQLSGLTTQSRDNPTGRGDSAFQPGGSATIGFSQTVRTLPGPGGGRY